MDIKKERLEEIVKEELEAFYEGEVPMEEGAGSKIADVIAKLTGKYTPKDPGLEAEEAEEKEKQWSKGAQRGLAKALKDRPPNYEDASELEKRRIRVALSKLVAKKSEV